ncbi:hypothetical protein [Campylobacter hominis]
MQNLRSYKFALFDQFPHTKHVESIVFLHKL